MSLDAEERADQARPALWVGAAGALLTTLFGLFGPMAGSIPNAPRVLEANVERALSAAGYPGLDVGMWGQQAVIAGHVRAETDLATATRTALTAAGAGGLWAGGVTKVNATNLAVGLFESPFAWRAQRTEEQIIMTGAVPSERARGALMVRAREVFPNQEAVDAMHVAGGAPSANWTDVALQAITELATLKPGAQARFLDTRIVIIGDGEADVVAALRQRYDHAPAPYIGRVEATVNGRMQGVAALQDVDFTETSPAACERYFARLMDANVINFAPGSASIDASSMALINDLGSVALRCDGSTIEVAGHTDNNGAPAFNLQLSQERADAVVAALASQGVSRERLRAVGYGHTRPRASNRTPSGQAANRRIEFTIATETP